MSARRVARWTAAIAVCLGALALPVGAGAVGPAPETGSGPGTGAGSGTAPASDSGSAAPTTAPRSSAPRLGPDRVVLQTTAGDVVLGFYPDAAPRTVANILAVARSGALDGVDFFRVVAGYLVQLAPTERTTPLTSAQQAVISRTVPLEVTSGLLHHRGELSMAHYDGKPDSGGASFSILLGDAPSLDGKYTIFGDVEQGMDVVDEIAAVPVSGSRPVVPIVVTHALVTDVAGLAATHLRGPIPIGGTGGVGDISTWPRLLVSTPMGDVLAILSPRDAPQHVKLLESLVTAGAYNGAYLGRAAPGSYVQWFPSASSNAASILPVEPGTVGNVAGALTIDSRDAEQSPALTFLLADNRGLDGRYTAIGWVIQGSDVLDALARVPTGSDRRPRQTLLVTKATILSGGSGVVVIRGLNTSGSSSTTPWAAFGVLAAATLLGGLIFVFSKRLTPALTASAGLLVVLLGFFGLWVGLVPQAGGTSQWLGLALFAGAIALFRLMGRFERGRPVGPPPTGPEGPGAEAAPAAAVPGPEPAPAASVRG